MKLDEMMAPGREPEKVPPQKLHIRPRVLIDKELESADFDSFQKVIIECVNSIDPKVALSDLMNRRAEMSEAFVPMLINLWQRLARDLEGSTDEMLRVLRENIDEEMGDGATEFASICHAETRRCLMNAVCLPEHLERAEIHPVTSIILRAMSGLAQDSQIPVRTVYAMMAYWEWRVSQPQGDYAQMLKACEQIHPDLKREVYVPGDALYHVYAHAELDKEHAEEFMSALADSVRDSSDLNEVIYGIRYAQLVWNYYWKNIGGKLA